MAVLPIVFSEHPVLRRRARRVTTIDRAIQKLIDDMLDSMRHASGVGLAAPQVGASLRIIVMQMPDEEPIVIINPEVVKRKGEREVVEGCLSVPGYRGEIKRSASIIVKGLDRQGKAIRINAKELMAQALEHEIDHLNGVLYVDHVHSKDKLHKIDPEPEPTPEASI